MLLNGSFLRRDSSWRGGSTLIAMIDVIVQSTQQARTQFTEGDVKGLGRRGRRSRVYRKNNSYEAEGKTSCPLQIFLCPAYGRC